MSRRDPAIRWWPAALITVAATVSLAFVRFGEAELPEQIRESYQKLGMTLEPAERGS